MRRASSPRREQDSSKTDANLGDSSPAPPEMGGIVLRIVPAESGDQKDRNEPRAEEIKLTGLDEAQQAEWLPSREFLR